LTASSTGTPSQPEEPPNPALDTQESISGCQYTSTQYANPARDLGVTLSVGRRGQCWDNAVAESFFATLKTELIHHRAWPTRKAATSAIFNYIEGWYNTRRRHSTLSYLSPATFESTRATTHEQVA
jgi:transposase InsO family protein